jgi:uncharacterized membrane protein YjgN (DUF898 family)
VTYPPPYAPVPDHPRAATALVLGIVAVVVCGLVGPFAWSVGRSTLAEIDASGGRWGGRGQAQAGYVLGIIGTVLLVLPFALVAYITASVGFSALLGSL